MTLRMNRRTLLKTHFLAGSAVLARTAFASETDSPVAQTRYGRVRGVERDGISIFKGIPYGGATEGAGRFLPPQKPQKWTGILDVSQTGPRCIQAPGNLFDTAIGDYFCGGRKEQLGLSHQTDSENCLALNVLTPGLKGKRPTMVYIHGGGYTSGSSIIALAADAFPREEDVVLVSVNHRLNIFGFTYLGGISEKFADSGNAGMLDLVAALEWVRDNISNFGGDPGNVTIFGESGGGGKVSGPDGHAVRQGTLRQSDRRERILCAPATKSRQVRAPRHCLRNLGSRRIAWKTCKRFRHLNFCLRVGRRPDRGRTLHTATDLGSGSAGDFATVPLIVGTCKDESAWLIGERDPSTFTLNEADSARLERSFRIPTADIEELITIYRKARPNATASDVFFEISSDRSTRMNAISQAERKTVWARRRPSCIILRTTLRWMEASTAHFIRQSCHWCCACALSQFREGVETVGWSLGGFRTVRQTGPRRVAVMACLHDGSTRNHGLRRREQPHGERPFARGTA